MTREEAIKVITSNDVFDADLIYEAVSMAIKALEQEPKTIEEKQAESEKYQKAFDDGYENGYAQARFDYEQEPCEDAISRQAVLDYIDKMPSELTADGRRMIRRRTLEEYISDTLPPVKPQEPKTGHWIEVIDEIDSLGNKTWHHKCSICGNEDSGWGNYKYCPNCGARMESEDKE